MSIARARIWFHSLRTMITTSINAKESLSPRPSASLVVVNSSNEVLLVQRNPAMSSYAGMHVFPGGNYDEKRDESYQMTAIREAFEETGLLLASPTMPESNGTRRLSDAVLDAMRASTHAEETFFDDFLKKYGLVADVEALHPFTEWITPLGPPRRFHARFYITFLSSSSQHRRLPTPDSNVPRQEVIETRFVHPQDALAEHRAKKIALPPPQHYILTTLADILVGCSATSRQRERVNQLSAGAFGRMVVHPRAGKKDASGRIPLVYEGDEERGGPKGRLHRSLVLFSPESKLPTEVTLLRNFDIFNGAQTIESVKL
ncbi:NUDIX hydrolase domain-like protein [Lactifluus volemus]|nr:NUDIX hydrolase domain-like protein [Lactifluus volemus]